MMYQDIYNCICQNTKKWRYDRLGPGGWWVFFRKILILIVVRQNIGLSNGFDRIRAQSSLRPLPKPMMTKICGVIDFASLTYAIDRE